MLHGVPHIPAVCNVSACGRASDCWDACHARFVGDNGAISIIPLANRCSYPLTPAILDTSCLFQVSDLLENPDRSAHIGLRWPARNVA